MADVVVAHGGGSAGWAWKALRLLMAGLSLDAALMYARGQAGTAVLYVLVSVVVSIAAVFAGLAISRTVFQ